MEDIDRANGRVGGIAEVTRGGADHLADIVEMRWIVNHQADRLELGDRRDHRGVDRRNRFELAGPGVAIVGPYEVAGAMRSPFWGHPIVGEQAAMLRWNCSHDYDLKRRVRAAA